MSTQFYVTYILCITAGMTYFYSVIKDHYSGKHTLQAQVEFLQSKYDKEKLKNYILSSDFEEYRQMVAENIESPLLKQKKSPEKGYPLRTLASLSVRFPPMVVGPSPASELMREGKELFSYGDYEQAKNSFEKVVNLHDGSVHSIEAHFLLAESFFQMENYEACIDFVNKMVIHFPEHELTGFGLMRLAAIFEIRERGEEAAKIYRTILKNYESNDLKLEARSYLSRVET